MSNPFDQFDAPAAEANPFDRFDNPNHKQPGQMRSGFNRAFSEVPAMTAGSAAYVADVAGATDTRDKILKYANETSDATAKAHEGDASSITDAWDGKTPWGDFLKNSAGYVAGQAVQGVVTGGLGALGGKMLAKQGAKALAERAGTEALARGATADIAKAAADKAAAEYANKIAVRGAVGGAGAQNLNMELGSIYPDAVQEATDQGRTLDAGDKFRVGASAVGAAAVDTAAEAVTASRVFRGSNVGAGATKAPTVFGSEMLGRAAREIPAGMAREAGTEGVQTAIEHYGAGQPIADEKGMRDIVDSMGVGAVGGLLGGAGASLHANEQQKTPAATAPQVELSPPGQTAPVDQVPATQATSTPDRFFLIADGSVVRQVDFDAEVSKLPPDQQASERAKVLGLAPDPSKQTPPDQTFSDPKTGLETSVFDGGMERTYPLEPANPLEANPTLEQAVEQQILATTGGAPGPLASAAIGALRAGITPVSQVQPALSAFDQREADRPKSLDGDIATSAAGTPLTNRIMAAAAARSKAMQTGQSWQPVELGTRQFVIRPLPQDAEEASIQPVTPSVAAAVPVPSTDILNKDGKPFDNMLAAKVHAAKAGPGYNAIQLGKKAFVARKVEAQQEQVSYPQSTIQAPNQPGLFSAPPESISNDQNPAQGTNPPAAQEAREAPQAVAGNAAAVERVPATGGSPNVEGGGVAPQQAIGRIVRQVEPVQGRQISSTLAVSQSPVAKDPKADQEQVEKPLVSASPIPSVPAVDAKQANIARIKAASQKKTSTTASIESVQHPTSTPAASTQSAPIGITSALAAGTSTTATTIDQAAHAAATSPLNALPQPTDGQKTAGNYSKGHVILGGLDLSIENPAGSIRSGTDKSGKSWSNTLKHHYGYIKGTMGNDKDHVDVFVKPETPLDYSGQVFVIDQVHPETGRFDEHKVMVGFPNILAAQAAYMSNYAKGWKGLKAATPMAFEDFKTWVKAGPKNIPLSKDKSVLQPVEQSSAKQPTAPSAVDKKKIPLKQRIEQERQARADYFTPGNIVTSYGGHDEVLSYTPKENGAWSVKVHAVKKINGEWVRIGKPQDARNHSTQPDAREVKAGPLDKVSGAAKYTESRADGKPFPNADARGPEVEHVPAAPAESPVSKMEPTSKPEQPAQPVAQEPAKNAPKIEDAGQKIGGARKDRWKERGLDLSDLDSMSESEGAELATKANVWKPDYAAMSEAAEPVTAAMVKTVYDQLAAQPKKNTPEGRRNYVTMMQAVRKAYTDAKSPEDVKSAGDKLKQAIGLYTADPIEKAKAREVLFSVYKGRSDPFVLGYNELAKAKKLVSDGFPEKGEPWKKRLGIRAYGGRGITPAGISSVLKESAELGTPLTTDQIVSGYHRISNKDGQAVGYAASQEDAEIAAKTIYERDIKGGPADKTEPLRPNLDRLVRENLPGRIDRDVTADDFVKDLGFRGVEFGNWAAQDERQRIINMAYDGLMDLAEIMGVPPKAMSLNGTMGMAFGARGGGKFAAHYEPGKLVINMTKINGGGSMAHEWGHALDHYFGELNQKDAYTTGARGASGWYSEEQYKGIPRKHMEQIDGAWKTVEKTRLDNLRPEMSRAFDGVMSALFSGQETKAQMVRSEELKLERTQTLANREADPDTKAMYQRMVTSQSHFLEELRQDPESKMYSKGRSEFAKQAQKLSGKSTNGYWTRPTEMFARAFESWVFDKVVAMGARSDYLVHGVEEDRFAGGNYKGNPYPTGEERANINAAFDQLARTIQTKETDKGVAMFSSKPFFPRSMRSVVRANSQSIQKFVDGVAKVAKTVLPINVVANPGVVINAQGVNLASILGVNATDTGGAVVDGQIYLFSDNLRSMGDVKITLFHELFHFGLRKVIPSADYVALMQELGKSSTIAKMADKWKASTIGKAEQARHPTSVYNAIAIEEALAETEERLLSNGNIGTSKPLLIRQLLAWFSKVADRLGFDGMAQAMRRMTMTDAEKFVNQMVRAALGGNQNLVATQNRIADGVFSVSDPKDAASTINAGLSAATVTDLKHKFGNRLADFRGLALQTLGRRQLVDIYAKDIPMLDAYSRMVAQMDADKNEAGADADKLVTDWAKLKDERQLAELMHDATRGQIDPSKPFVEGDDENFYEALKDGYDRLSPEAKDIYARAREMYTEHHEKVRAGIKDRIDNSALSSTKRQALLEKMDGEFFKKTKGVYFPLSRFGQYLTIVKDASGEVRNVTRSETLNEAEETRRLLKRTYPAAGGFQVGKVLKAREFNAVRDGVGRSFMEDLFQTLEKTGASEELQESISQLYLASLPDLSWSKHGIHRKGMPGFSQDARRSFAQNMFHGGNYLAKLRFSDRLQSSLEDMQEHVDDQKDNEGYDSVKAQQVVDEMVKRHESLMNPKSNPISSALTSFGFVFHLGLSPASAIVNLSQTAMVAYPIMGSKWGFDKAATALLSASKQAASNKNDISKVLKGDELEAYNEAVRSGVIDVTMAHDLAGISQGEDAKLSAKIRPVMKWASFMFHHAEKFNRQVTFVASYRLARNGGAGHEKAYSDAVKATYDGHFDYSASNRARVMQGNWPKVILLFKQYAQNMIYTLSRNLQQAIAAETPQERTQARKAISGLLVSHALGAGVFGLPLVGTLLGVASMIGGDDDEPWDAQVALQNMLADTFGQKVAEVFAHGLSRLTPWDISGRVGLDRLLLPDVQEGLQGADAVNAWMASALGPVAGIAVNVGRGMQEMADGRYLKGLESMMPSALRGPLKAYRYETEGNVDKTGIVINDEVGAAGVAGQLLGFSPSETRLAQEGKSAIYASDRAIQSRRSDLVRQFALAAMAQDEEGKAEARASISRFNEKNPSARITPAQLMRSVMTRHKRIADAQQGVYLPRKRQGAMEAGRFALTD